MGARIISLADECVRVGFCVHDLCVGGHRRGAASVSTLPQRFCCDAPTAFWERPEVAALVRRAPRESVCCPAARYSSASGAWQGARMDGAALAFLGATSAFLLPGTVLNGYKFAKWWL